MQVVFVVEWWQDEKREKQRLRSYPLKIWSLGFSSNFKIASTSFKVDKSHVFVNTAKLLRIYYWQCNTGCLFREVTLKVLYDLSFTKKPHQALSSLSAVKSWKTPQSSEKTCSEFYRVWVKCSEGKNAWLGLLIRIGKINKTEITDPLFPMRKNKIRRSSELLKISRKSCASAVNRLFPWSQANFLAAGFPCLACWEQVTSRDWEQCHVGALSPFPWLLKCWLETLSAFVAPVESCMAHAGGKMWLGLCFWKVPLQQKNYNERCWGCLRNNGLSKYSSINKSKK